MRWRAVWFSINHSILSAFNFSSSPRSTSTCTLHNCTYWILYFTVFSCLPLHSYNLLFLMSIFFHLNFILFVDPQLRWTLIFCLLQVLFSLSYLAASLYFSPFPCRYMNKKAVEKRSVDEALFLKGQSHKIV
jgi:hypothetical protein